MNPASAPFIGPVTPSFRVHRDARNSIGAQLSRLCCRFGKHAEVAEESLLTHPGRVRVVAIADPQRIVGRFVTHASFRNNPARDAQRGTEL